MTTEQVLAFADALRHFRQQAGLTQEELAAQTGLGVRTISDLERGISRSPRLDTLTRLVTALNLGDEERVTFLAAARSERMTRPPDRSSPPRPALRHLAAPLTPLIGREHEEASITHLLQREEVRLLTLTGPPGIGKTRLAIQVAAGMSQQFADGVVFVDLATIREPALVLPAMAQSLGVRDTGARPLLDVLTEHCAHRQSLLVLDNFEQVLAAAIDVGELLAGCPTLKVLVTSRAVLRLRGEQEFAVSPLALPARTDALPGLEDLSRYSAVALFVQRAQAAHPTFQLTAALVSTVVEICRRLDGLPLAIELAAVRIKVLPPRALLGQLRGSLNVLIGGAQDLPERQRTLRSAIVWSHNLLTEAEQRLFRRLSVFVGGWTLEFADGVCREPNDNAGLSANPDPQDMLELLSSLVDKSLVMPLKSTANGEARFGLLETLLEYATEQLEASGEQEVYRRRHAQFLARRIEQGLPGEDDRVALERLDEELGNFHTALAWARDQGDAELGLRVLAVLWWYWYTRGPLNEGIAWGQTLLAVDQANRNAGRVGAGVSVWARALHGLAAISVRTSDYVGAVAYAEESLAGWREVGDQEGIATALSTLAHAALALDDVKRATALFEENLAITRTLGAPAAIARSLAGLADVALEAANYKQAEELIGEILALINHGHANDVAVEIHGWLMCLGEVYLRQGQFARAASLFENNLQRTRNLRSKRGAAFVLRLQAQVAYRVGALDRAESLLEESLALYREEDVAWGVASVLAARADVARAGGVTARAAKLYHESIVVGRSTHVRLSLVQGLEGLAKVARLEGRWEDAVQLWAVTQTQRETLGIPLWPIDQPEYEQEHAFLLAALGEKAFAVAWADGRDLTPEQALAKASEHTSERI